MTIINHSRRFYSFLEDALMSKRQWLLFAAVVGLVAVEACSDSDTTSYPPATAGGAGKAAAPAATRATRDTAGQPGRLQAQPMKRPDRVAKASSDAGAGGAAGGSEAGASNGGSGGAGEEAPCQTAERAVWVALGNMFTLQSTTLGQVIGTVNGLSLYVFNTDTAATSTTPPVSTCTAGCLTNWPIYYGTPVSVPAGLLASRLR